MVSRFTLLLMFFCFIFVNPAIAYHVEHKVLKNGMDVYVIPDHSMPIVAHVLLYKVGGANDPYGKSGLAHLLEHMMFRKSEAHNNISDVINDFGGHFNAFTSGHFTVYHMLVQKKKLVDVMRLEADRMRNLVFDDDQFILERKIVLEERKMRIDSVPRSKFLEQMHAAFYMNDKSWQVAGWAHEINQLTKDDAKKMYNSFYTPDNAVLILSGDVTLKEVESMISEHYEGINNNPSVSRDSVAVFEPEHLSNIVLSFVDSRIIDKELLYFFSVPNNLQQKVGLALEVGCYILGGGKSSRLYRSLVMDEAFASDVVSTYNPLTESKNMLYVSVSPRDQVPFAKVEQNIMGVLDDLLVNGVTSSELEIAKSNFMLDVIQLQQDGIEPKAIVMAISLGMGFTDDYVRNLSRLLTNLTVNDVNQALKVAFSGRNFVKGCMLSEIGGCD